MSRKGSIMFHQRKYHLRPQYWVNEGKSLVTGSDIKIHEESQNSCLGFVTPGALLHDNDLTPTASVLDESDNGSASTSSDLMFVVSHASLTTAAIAAISRKAADIEKTSDNILPTTGHGDNAVTFLGKPGKMPHLDIVKKNGGMACDKDSGLIFT